MNTRLPHALRASRTLLAHELREQAPVGLTLLAVGVAILLGVRVACDAEAGMVSAQLPFFVPMLAALLLAFPAADFFGRDVGSGLARTLAAAPMGRVQLVTTRLTVFGLVAAFVSATLGALEPGAMTAGGASRSAYSVACAPLLVFVALAGAWLQNAATAFAAGTLVYSAAWVGFGVASASNLREPDLVAAAQVFAGAFKDALSVATLLPSALAALVLVAALRGARRGGARDRLARRWSDDFAARRVRARFRAPSASFARRPLGGPRRLGAV